MLGVLLLLHGIIDIFRLIGNFLTDLCGCMLVVSYLQSLTGSNQSAESDKFTVFGDYDGQQFIFQMIEPKLSLNETNTE